MQRDNRNGPRKNHQINVSFVRLIDTDGTMLGVKPAQEALGMARQKNLDLVEIAPQAKPPVCKILDYSKYLYEIEKKSREARKKQKSGMLKEIQVRPRIASHDLETKVRHAEEFLQKHDNVRFIVVFHGRENQHKDLGRQMLTTLQERFASVANVEGNIQTAGNRMSITLTPKH